jgi:hypothetical protein
MVNQKLLDWMRKHGLEGAELGIVRPDILAKLWRYEMFLNEQVITQDTVQAVFNVAEKLKVCESSVYKSIAFFNCKPRYTNKGK